MDENYLIYTSYLDNGDFALRLFCVNPAENLQQCINQGRSAVFFSATLLPVQYYKEDVQHEYGRLRDLRGVPV